VPRRRPPATCRASRRCYLLTALPEAIVPTLPRLSASPTPPWSRPLSVSPSDAPSVEAPCTSIMAPSSAASPAPGLTWPVAGPACQRHLVADPARSTTACAQTATALLSCSLPILGRPRRRIPGLSIAAGLCLALLHVLSSPCKYRDILFK
jgi:hypothetical protein